MWTWRGYERKTVEYLTKERPDFSRQVLRSAWGQTESKIRFGSGPGWPKLSDCSAVLFDSIFDLEPGHRPKPSNRTDIRFAKPLCWREKCDWKFFQLPISGAKLAITWLAALGKISLKFVEKMSIFNRIYLANIMTSGPRSTSKACFVKKLSIAFLAPTSWFAALAPHSLRGFHVSIAYLAPISWQKRPCSQSRVKHVSVSTAMAFKASDRRHHAVEFIRRE